MTTYDTSIPTSWCGRCRMNSSPQHMIFDRAGWMLECFDCDWRAWFPHAGGLEVLVSGTLGHRHSWSSMSDEADFDGVMTIDD